MLTTHRTASLFVLGLLTSTLALTAALPWPPAARAEDAGAEDASSKRARETLGPFKRALKQALTEGLRDGPVQAIDACHTQAPDIAQAHSTSGVRVGRASHRLRNPQNAAPDWVQPVLDAYVADDAHRAPRLVALGDGRVGYVEPIRIQPLCLTCHGETLAPAVRARIDALYPEDAATGFAPGDLRGVWWVELPAE